MTYSYDEEPKKYKAEISAKDRKIAYLEELLEHEKAQHIKWQKRFFEMKELYEKCESITKQAISKEVSKHIVEINNGTESNSRKDMQ